MNSEKFEKLLVEATQWRLEQLSELQNEIEEIKEISNKLNSFIDNDGNVNIEDIEAHHPNVVNYV